MVIQMRDWALVRPARVAWRARRVQRARPQEARNLKQRNGKTRAGFLDQFSAMLGHQVDLMIRVDTQM